MEFLVDEDGQITGVSVSLGMTRGQALSQEMESAVKTFISHAMEDISEGDITLTVDGQD